MLYNYCFCSGYQYHFYLGTMIQSIFASLIVPSVVLIFAEISWCFRPHLWTSLNMLCNQWLLCCSLLSVYISFIYLFIFFCEFVVCIESLDFSMFTFRILWNHGIFHINMMYNSRKHLGIICNTMVIQLCNSLGINHSTFWDWWLLFFYKFPWGLCLVYPFALALLFYKRGLRDIMWGKATIE